jgi:hypothetical protein
MLMHKLGLASDMHVESVDFARYLDLFMNGLSEEQVELIKQLFKDHCSIGNEAASTET